MQVVKKFVRGVVEVEDKAEAHEVLSVASSDECSDDDVQPKSAGKSKLPLAGDMCARQYVRRLCAAPSVYLRFWSWPRRLWPLRVWALGRPRL